MPAGHRYQNKHGGAIFLGVLGLVGVGFYLYAGGPKYKRLKLTRHGELPPRTYSYPFPTGGIPLDIPDWRFYNAPIPASRWHSDIVKN